MIKGESGLRLPNPHDALSTFLLQTPIITMRAPLHAIKGTDTYKNLNKILNVSKGKESVSC